MQQIQAMCVRYGLTGYSSGLGRRSLVSEMVNNHWFTDSWIRRVGWRERLDGEFDGAASDRWWQNRHHR